MCPVLTPAQRIVLAAAAAALMACPPLAMGQDGPGSTSGPLDDKLVNAAVKRGIEFLWKDQHPKEHHWEAWTLAEWKREVAKLKGKNPAYNGPGCYTGSTSLVLLALLKAGVSQDDSRFQKAIKVVAEIQPTQTYARGLRAALFASLNRPKDYSRLMKAEKQWLLDSVYADGTYGYYAPVSDDARVKLSGHRDHSNTQYGILGVWLLSDADVEIPRKYWQFVQNGYLGSQCKDGGWNYYVTPNRYPATNSMTLASLASLFIVWDKLYADRCDRNPDPRLVKALERGLNWMGKNFKITGRYVFYTLYGVERVGVAGGLKYFGKTNWWDLCARYVLKTQKPDGSWGGGKAGYYRPAPVDTAWALLFLSYGRAPVVFNKLAYGRPGQWNSRPRDLARLTTWLGRTYERLFNWQIMPIDRPVEELLDAPILLLSGKRPIKLTDPQKQKLKEYVLGGGLLLGEAAGDSDLFDRSFRALVRELFPELEMKRLKSDHPIYTVQFRLDKPQAGTTPLPPLEGLSNGVRTMVVYSPKDLGCIWQGYDVVRGRTHFELGANLVQYVSDRGTGLVGRGTSYMVRDLGRQPERRITVGRLAWGGKFQWDPEPYAWRRVDVHLRNAGRMSVVTKELDFKTPVDPKAVPLVHLTGVGAVALIDVQKVNLKAYVGGGGLLLADAAGGNKAFTDSFTRLAGEMFGPLVPAVVPFAAQATDTGKVAMRHVGDLPRSIRPLTVLGCQPEPGRWGVLFLPYDLTAAMAGYPNVEPVGLTPQAANRFITALLNWRAAPPTVPGKN